MYNTHSLTSAYELYITVKCIFFFLFVISWLLFPCSGRGFGAGVFYCNVWVRYFDRIWISKLHNETRCSEDERAVGATRSFWAKEKWQLLQALQKQKWAFLCGRKWNRFRDEVMKNYCEKSDWNIWWKKKTFFSTIIFDYFDCKKISTFSEFMPCTILPFRKIPDLYRSTKFKRYGNFNICNNDSRACTLNQSEWWIIFSGRIPRKEMLCSQLFDITNGSYWYFTEIVTAVYRSKKICSFTITEIGYYDKTTSIFLVCLRVYMNIDLEATNFIP